ncbi:hypothetical protein Acr_10g0006540 [Actinidia rufa]|uniref:Uncharacterized protein n=1 Tax=Actinidia rufa TaxID=165716 RepID=A0A7J0FAN8_9ERIC|nr:hypothetical protein Acr_10g0006540 [Actinidia rufa]
MGRAAISLSKLADTAREELPSTMAAIRLSGMEISDLTLELSDLRNGNGARPAGRSRGLHVDASMGPLYFVMLPRTSSASPLTFPRTFSQEIAEGVNKSAEAVQAAKAGIRQIAMIEERANLPPISLQPLVAGAAKKTSRAVGNATKSFINLISGGELGSKNQSENTINRLEV